MIKQINQLIEFHEAYRSHWFDYIEYPAMDNAKLRASLIMEEAKEVCEELLHEDEDNMDKIAKEIVDLLYVTFGTIISYGLQDKIEACFDEVHRSNMSKLGEDGHPIYRDDGKVLKGPNYSVADIKSILDGPQS